MRVFMFLAFVIINTTLSLSYAQWDTDTLRYDPYKGIKEDFGFFDVIKAGGDSLTAGEVADSINVIVGGEISDVDITDALITDSVINNAIMNNPELDGIDILGGDIDNVDITNAEITDPDIDGGVIAGAEINDGEIKPQLLRLPNTDDDADDPSEGDIYWNTTVDSLRVYDGTEWRNIGQRGAGYWELHEFDDPKIQWNSTDEEWEECTTGDGCNPLGATTASAGHNEAMAAFFCRHVKGLDAPVEAETEAASDDAGAVEWEFSSTGADWAVLVSTSLRSSVGLMNTSVSFSDVISYISCAETF